VIGLPADWIWLQPYFIKAAIVFVIASFICFLWPLVWRFLDRFGPKNSARKKLRALRKDGVSLRNEGKFTTDPQSWTPRFLAWHAAVLKEASRLSKDLEASLDPINKISKENLETVAVNNYAHQVNVSFMSEVIRRIEMFLATGALYGH
jgi:hypothetical protein